MAGCFGSSPLSAGISSQTRIKTHFSDASPSQSPWERLEGFFFENHHDDVISCLMGFCYPDPKISRDALEDLFFSSKDWRHQDIKTTLPWRETFRQKNVFTVLPIKRETILCQFIMDL